MSSRFCVLLALLVALLVPGKSYGEELEGNTHSAAFAETEIGVPTPAAVDDAVDTALACTETAQPPQVTVHSNLPGVDFCLPTASFEEAIGEFRHAQTIKRRQRYLRRERERRRRIAKRRAERRKRSRQCVRYLAREYSTAGQARLLMGAPLKVQEVVCAANEIDDTIYSYGGGHAGFEPGGDGENGGPGYDCSGAVSFALHGGGFLESPLASDGLESWGELGPGRWITVYTNPGHAWLEVDGFRFDTREPPEGETGPRWHSTARSTKGFLARHPTGY